MRMVFETWQFHGNVGRQILNSWLLDLVCSCVLFCVTAIISSLKSLGTLHFFTTCDQTALAAELGRTRLWYKC